MVPQGAPAGSLLDFKHGGLGRAVVGDLAEWLVDRFPGAQLIVELPMRRPDDPEGPFGASETIAEGNDVFAVCMIGESASAVESTLLEHDPTFMYNAFVLRGNAMAGAWLESGSARLALVITGAYDGEGFVLLPIGRGQDV